MLGAARGRLSQAEGGAARPGSCRAGARKHRELVTPAAARPAGPRSRQGCPHASSRARQLSSRLGLGPPVQGSVVHAGQRPPGRGRAALHFHPAPHMEPAARAALQCQVAALRAPCQHSVRVLQQAAAGVHTWARAAWECSTGPVEAGRPAAPHFKSTVALPLAAAHCSPRGGGRPPVCVLWTSSHPSEPRPKPWRPRSGSARSLGSASRCRTAAPLSGSRDGPPAGPCGSSPAATVLTYTLTDPGGAPRGGWRAAERASALSSASARPPLAWLPPAPFWRLRSFARASLLAPVGPATRPRVPPRSQKQQQQHTREVVGPPRRAHRSVRPPAAPQAAPGPSCP